MIRIVREGFKIPTYYAEDGCKKCGTTFSFNETDSFSRCSRTSVEFDKRFTVPYMYVGCPKCGFDYVLGQSKEEIKEKLSNMVSWK